MTPGLALFYGGMIRTKNVLAMIVANFATIGVVSIVWAVVAYSIAFGPDAGHGLLGNLHLAGLAHPEVQVPGFQLTVPPLAFAAFQMMFAVITAALLTGTVAERAKFGAFLLFASTPRSPTGSSRRPAGWPRRAFSTSPVGTSSRSTPGLPRSRSPSSSAGARAGRVRSSRRTHCRSRCWVPASCGSAGSASTPAPLSLRGLLPRKR
jgi:hypothetical protein